MGSGSSWKDKEETAAVYRSYTSSPTARSAALESHRAVISEAREKIVRGEAAPKAARSTAEVYDRNLAKNRITHPSSQATDVIVVAVDNSGSNATIAQHLRDSSAHLVSFLKAINPRVEIAWVYFSDHGDGPGLKQEVDFLQPTQEGDKIMFSSLRQVNPAGGGDFPEAIECTLKDIAEIDFGHVPRERRALILVTDSVPHGMSGHGERDDHCPHQVDWRKSMASCREVFNSFEFVACGDNDRIARVQATMMKDDSDTLENFINLSSIPEASHRKGIVGNVILFLAARRQGFQTVEMFLAMLYRSWMESPIFGTESDVLAKERIRSFGKYIIGVEQSKIDAMMRDILS